MEPEKKRTNYVARPLWKHKERRADEPDSEADEGHCIGRDARLHQPSGHRERNLAFQMSRHETLGIFDQPSQHPHFNNRRVRLAPKLDPLWLFERDALAPEPRAEGGEKVAVETGFLKRFGNELRILAADQRK